MPLVPLPTSAGIGLRTPHAAAFSDLRPHVPFIEVHTENYLCGGPMRRMLHDLRPDYPISLHCVGLSLGSAKGINASHLERICRLANEIDPLFVSDHLSVSVLDDVYTNDLIPIPYNEHTLSLVAAHVDTIQTALGRQMLVENPAAYISFAQSEKEEGEFLSELARRTGCGILCDVNNIFVTAFNRRQSPEHALAAYDPGAVKELHVAGHTLEDASDGPVRIDTHDRPACDEVLALYGEARRRFGPVPSLLEWDAELPSLEGLLQEARRIEQTVNADSVPAYA